MPGSNFQGGDGNQDDEAPYTDWQGLDSLGAVDHYADPNAQDSTFQSGNSAKEIAPGLWDFTTQNDGSSPGNVNVFDAWSNVDDSGDTFLNLAFTRQATNGTAFLGFELNQVAGTWDNGFADVPCRTDGDLLVTLQVDGNDVSMLLETWDSLTCDPTTGCALTGVLNEFDEFTDNVDAQGAVNVAAITNYLEEGGPLPSDSIGPLQFGEASLNLTTLLEGALGSPCFNFGSIWMQTRSSTEFNSDMKDYIAPQPLLVRSCTISGTKYHDIDGDGVIDAGEPTIEGWKLYLDLNDNNALDAGEPTTLTDANGDYTFTDISDGTFTVREAPDAEQADDLKGFFCSFPSKLSANCEHSVTIDDDERNPEDKDFANYRKATITVEKQTVPDGAAGSFGFTTTIPGKASFSLTDGQSNSTTVDPGTYTATEDANADFNLTDITCSGDTIEPNSTDADRTATFRAQSGETIKCVFTNTRKTGKLTVEKQLVPDTDPGLFDLKIGDETVVTDGGDGATASRTLPTGDYDVSELAGTGTSLAKYDSKVVCDNGQSADPGTSLADVHVTENSDITCVFTNTRRTGSITVVKDLIPATDAGRFDLKVDATVVKAAAGDGDSGSTDVAPGDYTVSEDGANGTDLTKYDKSIACTTNGQASESGDGASLGGVSVDSNDTVVCTITNTRRKGSITVIKDLVPASDAGRFDLKVDADVVKAAAGDGDRVRRMSLPAITRSLRTAPTAPT